MSDTLEEQGIQRIDGLYGFEFRDVDQRRVPTEDRRSYNIKSLWQRNHEIVNLAAQGFKHGDIASILNITTKCVSDTLNSDLGRHKLSEIRKSRDEDAKKTAEKIRVIADKALNVYHDLFDDTSGEVGLKDKANHAGEFLKEISGLRAPTKIHSSSVSTVLTAEEIEAFKNRGLSIMSGESEPIDVTPPEKESDS